MSSLNLIWIWDGVTLLCVHPYSLWEGKDWMTAVYFSPCTHQKSTKALLKWRPGNNPGVRPGRGHHPRALCSCQEPFTPSRFSPNGTSESIKTIITAIPESKEIILGCQGKHGKGVWSYLVRNLLDMHLARQAITASISGGFFVVFFRGLNTLLIAALDLLSNRPLFEDAGGAFWSLLVGSWWETEIYVCVGWGADVINNRVFTPTIA